MRRLSVGSWCSVLMLTVALGGTSACSTREAAAKADVEAKNAERASEPEQVVQKIRTQSVPTPRSNMASSDTASSDTAEAASEPRAALGEGSTSAAGVSRANGSPLPSRGNGTGTITTKHLEAELNRLEAELAN